jgi:hypothetical protein
MSNSASNRKSARMKAQKHFAQAERPTTFQETVDRERAARDAKTARLRALRLEKEALDREEAAKLAEAKAAADAERAAKRPARRKRTTAKTG